MELLRIQCLRDCSKATWCTMPSGETEQSDFLERFGWIGVSGRCVDLRNSKSQLAIRDMMRQPFTLSSFEFWSSLVDCLFGGLFVEFYCEKTGRRWCSCKSAAQRKADRQGCQGCQGCQSQQDIFLRVSAPTEPVFSSKLYFQRMIRLYRILPWATSIMSKCSVGRILVSLSSHHLSHETIQGNQLMLRSEAETCSKKPKHNSLKDELLENISEH